ncbi:MAG TPA: hypothetical protein VMW69_03575 [Spirochaetia bacterium]|nr:hypothetical protein [Spirochaetia bacterium]
MGREQLRTAIFETIEFITETELRVSSKRLILGYFNMSREEDSAQRARRAVERYTQTELPTLDEIRGRKSTNAMSRLDKLVLTMEMEARRFDSEPPDEE